MKLAMYHTLVHQQLLAPNVQIIKFGMNAETAVKTFSAVRTKNVFLRPALLDAILVVNAQVECTQVQTTLIYA